MVGTKLDIIQKQGRAARQVDYYDVIDYAESQRLAAVLETSSLTGYNVGEFLRVIYRIVDSMHLLFTLILCFWSSHICLRFYTRFCLVILS